MSKRENLYDDEGLFLSKLISILKVKDLWEGGYLLIDSEDKSWLKSEEILYLNKDILIDGKKHDFKEGDELIICTMFIRDENKKKEVLKKLREI